MSSFIFPSVCLSFFFLLSCHIALTRDITGAAGSVLLAVIVGFTYWLHPVGLALALASSIAYATCCFLGRPSWNFRGLIVHLCVLIAMIGIYSGHVHGAWNALLTPAESIAWAHYPSSKTIFTRLISFDGIVSYLRAASGQMAYLLISTLGMGVLGFVVVVGRLRQPSMVAGDPRLYFFHVYLLIATMTLLGLGALAMTGFEGQIFRFDQLIYGRYHEFAYIPLMLIGVTAAVATKWNERLKRAAMAPFLLMLCIVLTAPLPSVDNLNQINIIGMFPIYWLDTGTFASPKEALFVVLGVGFLGVLLLWLFLPKAMLPAMLGLSLIAVIGQSNWHVQLLANYSAPSKLYSIIERNYPHGSCVAFDLPASTPEEITAFRMDQTMKFERFKVFEFYLHNYRYQRMSMNRWKTDCDGPYLTFRPDFYRTEAGTVWTDKDGLSLISKTLSLDICLPPTCAGARGFGFPDPVWTHVGKVRNAVLYSTGIPGYLSFGPYQTMERGKYSVVVRGRVDDGRGIEFDVTSGMDAKQLGVWRLGESATAHRESGELLRDQFFIPETIDDFQLRVLVGADSKISIESFEVRKIGEV